MSIYCTSIIPNTYVHKVSSSKFFARVLSLVVLSLGPGLAFSESLTGKNQFIFGTGFSYILDSKNNGLYQYRERSVGMPLSMGVDFTPSLSGSVSTALLRNSNERVASEGVVSSKSVGLGSTDFSVTYKRSLDASSKWPLLSITGGLSLPTGDAEKSISRSIGLGVVKVLSPVVLFASVGAVFSADYDLDGSRFTPGDKYNVGFGFSFFINKEVTFTSRVGVIVEKDIVMDKLLVSGSGAESVPLSFGFIYTANQVHSISPSLTLGLGGDADSSSGLSLSYSYRFWH